MAAVARWFVGQHLVRVPWSEIAYIGERVALRRTAVELELGAADRKWGRRIEKVPGA